MPLTKIRVSGGLHSLLEAGVGECFLVVCHLHSLVLAPFIFKASNSGLSPSCTLTLTFCLPLSHVRALVMTLNPSS